MALWDFSQRLGDDRRELWEILQVSRQREEPRDPSRDTVSCGVCTDIFLKRPRTLVL